MRLTSHVIVERQIGERASRHILLICIKNLSSDAIRNGMRRYTFFGRIMELCCVPAGNVTGTNGVRGSWRSPGSMVIVSAKTASKGEAPALLHRPKQEYAGMAYGDHPEW